MRFIVAVLSSLLLLRAPAAAGPIETAKAAANDFIHGDFAALHSRFAPELRKKLAVDQFTAQLGAAAKQLGAFEKFLAAEPVVQKASGYSVYVFPAKFVEAEIDMQVTIDGKGDVAGVFFRPPAVLKVWNPPSYVNSEAFRETDARIITGRIDLPGTLTRPKGDGPFPGVVLVHGSGPNDRDESHGPNRAFRDLAQGLATKGIAVLRYDKRTLVYPAGAGPATILEETVDDATTALGLLRATKGVDPKQVSVLGHSLGGMMAPRIAAGDSKIAGVIILAGNTRPLEDLIDEQADYFTALSAKPSDDEKKAYAKLHEVAARIRAITDTTVEAEPIFGAGLAYWKDLRKYNPVETAKQLTCRMLILQGERDFQVSMTKDFSGWKAGLAERKGVTFKSYAKLNHYFMEGEGKGVPAEYDAPNHVSEAVLADIAKWALEK